MEGIELIEPMKLYNLLNQGTKYPKLSDPNYLLLLDLRTTNEYMESHILTAKLVKKEGEDGVYELPYDAELETKQNVVLYDNRTSLSMQGAPAVEFAKILWENGSKYPVKVLKGGYETFSALYPYLRSQEMLYTPQQLDNIATYPVEIIPGFLYCGTVTHSEQHKINKDLKIKAYINASQSNDVMLPNQQSDKNSSIAANPILFNVSVPDTNDGDISKFFQEVCSFIDKHNNRDGKSVLVFSDLGISRSITISLAYLMHHYKWTLKCAWDYIKECKHNMCPNRAFVDQLAKWEQQILGETITNIHVLIS